jgi:hypothetical protein
LLEQADKLQQKYGSEYNSVIEYAYKLLLKNQAHDGICGCSTDLVHRENITRYEKIIQITNTIIEELRLKHKFKTPIMQSKELIPEYKIVSKYFGVENSLLYDTQKIPVTEDFSEMYNLKYFPATKTDLKLEVKNGKIFLSNSQNKRVQIEFVRFKDDGDTYNFGAIEDDLGEIAEVYSFKNNIIKTSFFDIQVEFGETINFKIEWDNKLKNHLWQVKFTLKKPITETYSEEMKVPDDIVPNDVYSGGINFTDYKYHNEGQSLLYQNIQDLLNTKSLMSTVNSATTFDYDVINMSDSDANFFANLVQNTDMSMKGIVANINDQVADGAQNIQQNVQVSSVLMDKLAESMKTNQPFRIDFDKDVSVIIKVNKDGSLSANFIPGDKAVEQYLRNNISFLKQRFDEQNLSYSQLSYSNSRQQQQQRRQNKEKQ